MEDELDDPSGPLSALTGKLIYGFAGDLYTYDLSSGSIDLIAELKGRQGPFISPDGAFFTTNNWPGNNEGVAVWSTESNTILKEFNLPRTLIADDLGVKIAPGGSLFSGILTASAGTSTDLTVLNDQGSAVYRLDGDLIRMKGHVWDNAQNLYFTGEVLQGTQTGIKILAKVANLDAPAIIIIRTFDGTFLDVPDQLAISRDGRQVTYAYNQDIWVGATSENASDHRLCFQATQTLSSPVFSPDAQDIAMVMRNSDTSLRGDIHIAQIPENGSLELLPDGPSKLPGPNSSLNSTWASGNDSSLGWIN
ncbi:MAG: hypothetical protein AB8G77_01200 [Rhodothermales bacterium]